MEYCAIGHPRKRVRLDLPGNWSSTDLVRTFLAVFVIAQVSYRQFWKPSGITTKVENATSRPSKRIASNTDLGERVRRAQAFGILNQLAARNSPRLNLKRGLLRVRA